MFPDRITLSSLYLWMLMYRSKAFVDYVHTEFLFIGLIMKESDIKARYHLTHSFDTICGPQYRLDKVPATRSDWKIVPMGEKRRFVEFNRDFSDEDVRNLSWGHISMSMDDRYGSFFEDGILYIYEGWGGTVIYELTLNAGPGPHRLAINYDEICYRPSFDEQEIETVNHLIDQWVSQATFKLSFDKQ